MLTTIHNASELTEIILDYRKKGLKIGFVPTMGALHKGHLHLVKMSKNENDITIVSIFVNPTQFNDPRDLEKYPRTLSKDQELLQSTASADILYAPDVDDIYPDGIQSGSDIGLGGLDVMMEGAHRPGHFNGVAQVVNRLLEIVKPDNLYMGQKDFQQFTIINYMLKSLSIPTKLRVCPIVREDNGLAMSSRNVRLSPEVRTNASIIFKTLKAVKQKSRILDIESLKQYAIKRLDKPPFKPEYFDIVDGNTLLPVDNLDNHGYIVACTAVWVEGVRLIDNMVLKSDL